MISKRRKKLICLILVIISFSIKSYASNELENIIVDRNENIENGYIKDNLTINEDVSSVTELDSKQLYSTTPTLETIKTFYYKQLTNEVSKNMYDGMKKDTAGDKEKIYISFNSPITYKLLSGENKDDAYLKKVYPCLSDALSAFIHDNPMIYWYRDTTTYSDYTLNKDTNTITFKGIHIQSDIKERTDNENFKNQVNSAVNSIKGDSIYEIAKKCNDFVCNHITYQKDESTKIDQTAYGALVKKKSVCEGYSHLFKILCDKKGVICLNITGRTGTAPDSGYHAWNYVYHTVEKKWYGVDPTWNDSGSNMFLVGADTKDTGDTLTFGQMHIPGLKYHNSQTLPEVPQLTSSAYKKFKVNLSYNTTSSTTKPVTVTIKSGRKLKALDGWSAPDEYTLTKQYTKNTTEKVTVTNRRGERATVEIKIDNISIDIPTFKVQYSETKPTNKNVTVKIVCDKTMKALTGWNLSEDKKILSKTYTGNKSEKVNVTATNGYTKEIQVNVSNIDKELPKISVEYSTKSITNQNVKVTIKANEQMQELEGWKLSVDKKSLEKTYMDNIKEEIIVKDLAGNQQKASIEINNIDKETSRFTVKYSHTTLTNQDIVVEISSSKEIKPLEGWNLSEDKMKLTKIYTENKTEKVQVESVNGNIEIIEIVVNKIDKEKPELKMEYSNTNITNEAVKVTIKSNEEIQTLDGWTLLEDKKSLEKNYIDNMKEEIIVKDLAGNEQKVIVEIKNIDKAPSKITVKYSHKNLTNENIVVDILSNKEMREIEGWELSEDKMKLTKIYEENQQEKVEIEFINGDRETVEILIDKIDKEKPELKVEYSNTNVTNEAVKVTIKANEELQQVGGWRLSEDRRSLEREYIENVKEKILVKDLAGNIQEANIEINNIDTETLKYIVKYSHTTLTNEDIVVEIISNKEMKELEGWELSEDRKKLTKIYTENIKEEVQIEDINGTVKIVEIVIDKIDKEKPELEVEYSNKDITSESVKVIIKSNEELQGTEGWNLSEDRRKLEKDFMNNIKEDVIVKDLAGNEQKVNIEINNIDKENARFTVRYSHTSLTNEDILVEIISNKEMKPIDGWELSEDRMKLTKVFTENQQEKVEVETINGKSEIIEIVVAKIDKEKPDLEVKYSNTNITSEAVKVTIKANEELQEVEGWKLSEDKRSLEKEYIDNVEEEIIIKDLAGNEQKVRIEINNIDKEISKFVVKYSHTTLTNEDIVVEIISNKEMKPIEGWILSKDRKKLTKIYTENQQEKIEVEAMNGDTEVIEIVIDKIDKEGPNLEIEYSDTEITSESVKVMIKSNEELKEIEGWILSKDKKILTKIFDENTEEIIEIQDISGNAEIVEIKIENIDKEKATYEIFYEKDEINGVVLVTIRSDKEIKPVEGWELLEDKKSIKKVYSENTEETISLEAINGIKEKLEIQVNSIKIQQGGNDTEKVNGSQTDETVSDKILPKAGFKSCLIIGGFIVLMGVVFYRKYSSYKDVK